MDRDEVTRRIKAALYQRTGLAWRVFGGRGTAWGWIDIKAPRVRLVCACKATDNLHGEICDHKYASYMSIADQAALRKALGFDPAESAYPVGWQGVSIPASSDYWDEYVARAEGRKPARCGHQYWD